ncbi:MAG: alpha/beta fold hydrolase [Deltaproteobacteria bacterium]|jgi:pimeloyl-ACP methyl ester carboxylesterase|nr:alpha/beta fold hydrolase [Deltaproteobacteria bacterium]
MSFFRLGPQTGLHYEHHLPADDQGVTFVFFNALTGDTAAWEGVICPILRNAGHGTLVYNMRGQTDSPFEPDAELGEKQIVADAAQLLGALSPIRPILVGLSIGGLFACRTLLSGIEAIALVLINTLRREGPRLKWIGDALVRAVEIGGLPLFRDLFLPLLMSEDWLQKNRSNFLLADADYAALEAGSGHYKLLAEAGRNSDWNIPYEQLTLPTLVITGLQDHVFFEKDVVETLFARIPDGRRIDMPAAGHLIPSEQPAALADALIKFAKEIS